MAVRPLMETTGNKVAAVALTSLRLAVTVLGFAASLGADAQPTGKVYRIGYLSTGSASTTYTRPLDAFRQGLHELGWVEGRNVHIEFRFAEGQVDRLPALPDELVRVAGKGNEEYQQIGAALLPFSDRDQVQRLIEEAA